MPSHYLCFFNSSFPSRLSACKAVRRMLRSRNVGEAVIVWAILGELQKKIFIVSFFFNFANSVGRFNA